MSWLITGGCGYIGSHLIDELSTCDEDIICVDSLISGYTSRIGSETKFIKGDIRDKNLMKNIFSNFKVTKVVHLAALKSVADSKDFPELYRSVNIESTQYLVRLSILHGVQKFIFASSAAVYGNTSGYPINENQTLSPLSIYGQTKVEAENFIQEETKKGNINALSLRFFNVAGAKNPHLSDNSTQNLIPLVIKLLKSGQQPVIFGNNHKTIDGTCERDYIHVQDISKIIKLIDEVEGPFPTNLNIGTGIGYSVAQVISGIAEKMGVRVKTRFEGPRQGDPASVIADPTLLKSFLGFKSFRNLESIIESSINGMGVSK